MVGLNTILIIILFAFCLWLPQAVFQIIVWTYWWQVKEYRVDRFWVFLKSSDGRKKLGVYGILVKVLSVILGTFYLPIPFIVFFYFDIIFFRDLIVRRIRKPVVTKRIEKIWLTSLVGIIITVFATHFMFANAFLVGEMLLILTPYLGILWTIPISNRVKNREVKEAREILGQVNPIVIGVTGSYGKTTTKDFIAQLLSAKFSVAKTEGSQNTEFGLARNTKDFVKPSIKIFVVEMGAYKIGEIKKLAEIVNPTVGVITGIEEQHLALFGSLENIKKAKFELIESLPQKGTAIFNLSNAWCRELYGRSQKDSKKLKVYGYRLLSSTTDKKGMLGGDNILYSRMRFADERGVEFETSFRGEKRILKANLAGTHFLENLSGAILIARLYGVSWEDIDKACRNLVLPEKTMQVRKLANGAIIIDDAHNSTPHAFESALDYLSFFKRKKIVVTSGIIELGKDTRKFHEAIGKKMLNSEVNKILLTSREFERYIKDGLRPEKNKLLVIENAAILLREIKKVLNRKHVILLEGRLPSQIDKNLE